MGNLQSYPCSNTKYDVFLSFRGEDTRDCFTSHLYEALRRKQIETYIDDQLIRGDEIAPALMKAIEESKISVVIFSKDYASSKWCLRELVEILKCKETNNQIVLPVFYRVHPSVVRNQTGSFNDSFVDHEKKLPEEVITWRRALAEASHISGWHSSVGRTDATLVEEIVDDIWKKLMSEYVPPDFGGLIGLEPRIEQIISLLRFHVTTDVRIIGIWGMGGIGKTTLADAIFNQNKNQFEGVCFIQNVREKLANSGGVVSVQKEILSYVLKDEGIKLDSLTIPPNIKERLKCLKVLIVLDDVDNYSNMKDLVKGVDGLGQGSRIIITSRNKQAFQSCYVTDDNIYQVKGLNHLEALRLFCMHAFHENRHSEDPMVNRLVKLIDGNPLVLKVLGSALRQKSKEEWESVVNKFEPTNLSSEIFDMLKISYDGLTDIQKGIFLAIACCLKGRARDYVAKILDDCDYPLGVLIDKSLITISSNHKIEMHDLLEEMGKNIVDKESPNKIGKRSWLWRQEDVLCTLENDFGTPEVQGIVLEVNKIKKDIHLSSQVFKKMCNLRILKFYHSTYIWYSKVNCSEGLSVLSNKLRSLIWYGYPLQALPSNFDPNNLVELDLRGSNLERLWEDCMHTPKLRWLTLSGCTRVTKIPNLSKSLLLETINLKNCSSLLGFTQLYMEAPKLRELNLSGCTCVTEIPDLSKSPLLEAIDLRDCSSLLDFPQLAQHLKNLRDLCVWGCNSLRSFPSEIHFESPVCLDFSSCNNLTKFGSQISGNITRLNLSGTAIKELHHSIAHLNGLKELFLRGCENLETLPSSICKLTSLQHLDLSGFSRLEILLENSENLKSLEYLSADRIQLLSFMYHLSGLTRLILSDCNLNYIPKDIGCLSSLVELDLSVNNFEYLPQSMMDLRDLEFLHLDSCNMVLSLIDLPSNLTHLSACDCKQLQSIPNELVFARILTESKPKPKPTEFIFTNCMNLEETAVGNMLARLMKYLHQGYADFIFYYPGSRVPMWFRYTTKGSSIKFQKTFNRIVKGFAVCAVIAFKECIFNGDSQHKLEVYFDCRFSSPTCIESSSAYVASRRTLIDSDHVAFGYFSSFLLLRERWIENYSFECWLLVRRNCRLKSFGVCPIYFQDPDTDDSDEAGTSGSRFDEEEMEPHPKENENLQAVKNAEPIEHIGETSGIRRSRTSNDHLEEEVEPHPKRLNI